MVSGRWSEDAMSLPVRSLIGPNGAGKTTCVNVLTGVSAPHPAGCCWRGALSRALAHRIRRGTHLPGGAAFSPDSIVLDNLACTGVGLGLRRREAEHQASALRPEGIATLVPTAAGLPYTERAQGGHRPSPDGRAALPAFDEPAAGICRKPAADLAARRIALERGIGCLPDRTQTPGWPARLDGGAGWRTGHRARRPRGNPWPQAVREAYLGANLPEAVMSKLAVHDLRCATAAGAGRAVLAVEGERVFISGQPKRAGNLAWAPSPDRCALRPCRIEMDGDILPGLSPGAIASARHCPRDGASLPD